MTGHCYLDLWLPLHGSVLYHLTFIRGQDDVGPCFPAILLGLSTVNGNWAWSPVPGSLRTNTG